MTGNLITGQGKKLVVIAVFLVIVALLVGGEDDPGMIGELAETTSFNPVPDNASEFAHPVEDAPGRKAALSRQDSSLTSWYAQSESTGAVVPEPVEPTPVDDSHLINDAKPLVSASPPAVPSAIIVEGPAPAVIE
jgi:hypothetical protein